MAFADQSQKQLAESMILKGQKPKEILAVLGDGVKDFDIYGLKHELKRAGKLGGRAPQPGAPLDHVSDRKRIQTTINGLKGKKPGDAGRLKDPKQVNEMVDKLIQMQDHFRKAADAIDIIFVAYDDLIELPKSLLRQ
jgi:hypothetical protein